MNPSRHPSSRRIVLAALIACAALIATGAVRFGLDSVNVITLYENPLQIWLYWIAPTIGFVIALTFLAFPTWVGINLVEVLVLVAIAEVIFGRMLPVGPKIEGDPVSLTKKTYLRADPRVGYVLEPDNVGRHVRTSDGKVSYDVRYVIDAFGRRKVDAPHAAGADRFLLFLGDSNTFGEGLAQGETLPDAMQRLWAECAAYNYGVHGYGMAQMLDVIASRDLANEVRERRGVAFYYFIHAHMARLVGSTQVSPTWGRRLSYYRLEEGRPERIGDFATGRQFLTLFYGLVAQSNAFAYFGITIPRSYSDADYSLAAAIVAESRARLQQQLQLDDFYFVLSPTVGSQQAQISERVAAAIRAKGLKVIDLTQSLDLNDLRYRVAEDDYHQSAEANRVLAEKLSDVLRTDHPEVETDR